MASSILKEKFYKWLSLTKTIRWIRSAGGRTFGTLCYHNVLPDEGFTRKGRYHTDFPVSVMDRQLSFLARNFNMVPQPGAEGFSLSFDDGMQNNYHVLLPLLRRYGLKAMFAVCTDLVDGHLPYIWRDHIHLLLRQCIGKKVRLPMDSYEQHQEVSLPGMEVLEAKFKAWVYQNRVANVYEIIQEICRVNGIACQKDKPDPLRFQSMDWQQVRRIQAEGHTIVSHSASHRVLRHLSDAEMHHELLSSRLRLQEMLQVDVTGIVYPYGGCQEVDARVVEMASACGYTHGYLNVADSFLPVSQMAQTRFGLPHSTHKPYLEAVVTGFHDHIRKMLSPGRR